MTVVTAGPATGVPTRRRVLVGTVDGVHGGAADRWASQRCSATGDDVRTVPVGTARPLPTVLALAHDSDLVVVPAPGREPGTLRHSTAAALVHRATRPTVLARDVDRAVAGGRGTLVILGARRPDAVRLLDAAVAHGAGGPLHVIAAARSADDDVHAAAERWLFDVLRSWRRDRDPVQLSARVLDTVMRHVTVAEVQRCSTVVVDGAHGPSSLRWLHRAHRHRVHSAPHWHSVVVP